MVSGYFCKNLNKSLIVRNPFPLSSKTRKVKKYIISMGELKAFSITFWYWRKVITVGNPKKWKKYSISLGFTRCLVFAITVSLANFISYKNIPGVNDMFLKWSSKRSLSVKFISLSINVDYFLLGLLFPMLFWTEDFMSVLLRNRFMYFSWEGNFALFRLMLRFGLFYPELCS